jgi:hypothetical protein
LWQKVYSQTTSTISQEPQLISLRQAPGLKEGYSVIPNRSELIDENRLHFGGSEYVDPLMIVKPMKVAAAGNDQIKFVC